MCMIDMHYYYVVVVMMMMIIIRMTKIAIS